MPEHPAVKAGRERKAMALEHELRALKITATDAATWPLETRNLFAGAHGIRPPSDETWALVIRMMRDQETHGD